MAVRLPQRARGRERVAPSPMHGLCRRNLEYNQLSGTVPASIYDLTGLMQLCVRVLLPPHTWRANTPICTACCRSLDVNKLSGTIADSIGNLVNMWYLCVLPRRARHPVSRTTFADARLALSCRGFRSNELTGTLPASIGNLANVQTLCVRSRARERGGSCVVAALSSCRVRRAAAILRRTAASPARFLRVCATLRAYTACTGRALSCGCCRGVSMRAGAPAEVCLRANCPAQFHHVLSNSRACNDCACVRALYRAAPLSVPYRVSCCRDLQNNSLVGTIPETIWGLPHLNHVCVPPPPQRRCLRCVGRCANSQVRRQRFRFQSTYWQHLLEYRSPREP